jgi:hypothetical protein
MRFAGELSRSTLPTQAFSWVQYEDSQEPAPGRGSLNLRHIADHKPNQALYRYPGCVFAIGALLHHGR